MNSRGLNTSIFTSNNPVVIYIDGVPYSHAFGFDASLVNVERIEVLRGSQGTLYGKDAIGAVINIVTQDPGDTWQGAFNIDYGSFNTLSGSLNLSGPIVKDRLFLGVNGFYQQSDGWIENDYPGGDEDADRETDSKIGVYLLCKPTDRFEARLTVANDYSKDHWDHGYGLPGGSRVTDFERDDAEHVRYDEDTFQDVESSTQSLVMSYAFGRATLTSTTTPGSRHPGGL
ncbi:MAG TPA: hypothetical protein ENN66_08655 [Proteobacteria bacterium]|nr:hypothetical protein [Pseudomonadota bacterium]